MAGITGAMTRVIEGRNKGTVAAEGFLKDPSVHYLIIRLEAKSKAEKSCGHAGLITVYDHGTDVRIRDDIEVGDDVVLMILDNYCAAWMTQSEAYWNRNA